MDLTSPVLGYTTQCTWSCPSSDSEFYNISSPEADSSSSYMEFSPSSQTHSGAAESNRSMQSGETKASTSLHPGEENIRSRGRPRRSRSKNRSKQRESASEKEKLRMRDLTKALHHLRSYLPPSVAPAGQSLTKIETLRRTIRYISYLSAQLGLSEEVLGQRKDMIVSRCQMSSQSSLEEFCPYTSSPGFWGSGEDIALNAGPSQGAVGPVNSFRKIGMEHHQFSMDIPSYDNSFNSSMDSLLESSLYAETSPSCQDYSKAVHYQSFTPEFWI
ncbi:mesoderm posterior protein 2-like [Chanos chanos]|uniref:Mesoderm posterior protein 2-like n=1 Tax=Chanos chanos TaxID=29144 RepID=A0A6J2WHD9_CHACN|nr:mesoderm posterior protein 2-like [Chanos chanos]